MAYSGIIGASPTFKTEYLKYPGVEKDLYVTNFDAAYGIDGELKKLLELSGVRNIESVRVIHEPNTELYACVTFNNAEDARKALGILYTVDRTMIGDRKIKAKPMTKYLKGLALKKGTRASVRTPDPEDWDEECRTPQDENYPIPRSQQEAYPCRDNLEDPAMPKVSHIPDRSTNLNITNFPKADDTNDKLKTRLERLGARNIVEVRILKGGDFKYTSALVSFQTVEDAEAALNLLDGLFIGKSYIKARYSMYTISEMTKSSTPRAASKDLFITNVSSKYGTAHAFKGKLELLGANNLEHVGVFGGGRKGSIELTPYAVAYFQTVEDATAALGVLQGAIIDGSKIKVRFSNEQSYGRERLPASIPTAPTTAARGSGRARDANDEKYYMPRNPPQSPSRPGTVTTAAITPEPEENQLVVQHFPFHYIDNRLHKLFVKLGVQGLKKTKIRRKYYTEPCFSKGDLYDENTGKITYLSNADHWDPKKGKFLSKVANLFFANRQLAIDALPIIDGYVLTDRDIEGDFYILKAETAIRGPIGELSVVPETHGSFFSVPQNPFPHFRGRYQAPGKGLAMQGSQPPAPQSPQRVIPLPVQYPSMAMQGSQPPAPQSPQGVFPPPVQYPGVALQGQSVVDDAAFNALIQDLDRLLLEKTNRL